MGAKLGSCVLAATQDWVPAWVHAGLQATVATVPSRRCGMPRPYDSPPTPASFSLPTYLYPLPSFLLFSLQGLIFGPQRCLKSWKTQLSVLEEQTTAGSRGNDKEGDSDVSHRTRSCPSGPGLPSTRPPPLFQPRGPSALPPSTQMTVGNDSHPFPVPSQGLCSQKGSFPELSPEQAHLPLPTLLGESVGTGTRPSDPGRC